MDSKVESKISNEFTKVVNNIFIEGKLNFKSEPNDNFELTMYSQESNIAYRCIFSSSNITVPNTNLEGIYKMILNALNSNPSYSIKWELKDFNIVITYNHDIFTFTQTINFVSIDSAIPQLKSQLYQSKQEVNLLKQQTVSIERFCELAKQVEDMKNIIETLKVDIGKLNQQNNTISTIPNNPSTNIVLGPAENQGGITNTNPNTN